MKRAPVVRRTGVMVRLRCVCGSTLTSSIPIRGTDAIKLRDCYLACHQDAACRVTDTSEDID